MKPLAFGAGTLWVVNAVANPTPIRLGVLQNVSVDFKANVKSAFGSNQFPEAVARGAMTVSGKAEFLQLDGAVLALFFGAAAASGQTVGTIDESGTVPSTTSYTITVANSATWIMDLGVVDANTGEPYVRVASSPTTGQYSVAAGVYTFAAADASAPVKISYTSTITDGNTVTISNSPMGQANTFVVVFATQFAGKKALLKLNACTFSGLSLQSANEDFTKESVEFSAFIDSTQTLGLISVAQPS